PDQRPVADLGEHLGVGDPGLAARVRKGGRRACERGGGRGRPQAPSPPGAGKLLRWHRREYHARASEALRCGILAAGMSQENLELVMSLQRSGEEDFSQLIRDDERWRMIAVAAAPIVHGDVISERPGVP